MVLHAGHDVVVLSKFRRALGSFEFWTICKMGFCAREEILSSDSASVAHASEHAALIVKVYRRVKLSHIAGIHH